MTVYKCDLCGKEIPRLSRYRVYIEAPESHSCMGTFDICNDCEPKLIELFRNKRGIQDATNTTE